jgi:hypothetical protein
LTFAFGLCKLFLAHGGVVRKAIQLFPTVYRSVQGEPVGVRLRFCAAGAGIVSANGGFWGAGWSNGKMKRQILIVAGIVVLPVFCNCAEAALTFLVDLGTVAGEAGYTLTNWGPIEPTTHPGGWGGIAGDPVSYDKRCRTVWGYVENTKDASITFPSPIVSAIIRHLDGGSDDSFKVEVGGSLWGSYSAVAGVGEFWTLSSFFGTPGTTLTITCTGAAGPYWNPYGQVGIDRIEAEPIPEPGTILLLGLGGLGVVRRRRGNRIDS